MNRVGSPALAVLAALLTMAIVAPEASAQEPETEPIGRFAADARVALPRFPEDGATAATLGVTTENLPSRGLGVAAGVTFYPARLGKVALGVGGEWLIFSRGRNTLDPQTEGERAVRPSRHASRCSHRRCHSTLAGVTGGAT